MKSINPAIHPSERKSTKNIVSANLLARKGRRGILGGGTKVCCRKSRNLRLLPKEVSVAGEQRNKGLREGSSDQFETKTDAK